MRKAAENMYYPAQLYLGVAYFYGEGVPQDYRQAVYWLNEGIPSSYTPGHIPLNALYDKAHPADRVHSQTWYRKTAQRVMAKVQYNFGVWYYNGYHLLKDHNLALEWYRRAAAQGLAEAQDAIGVMFMQGEGVSQDYQQALAWYRKAARQGLPAAQTHLGIMSAFGRGVAQSDRQAIAWYRKAAKQDFAKAQYQLGVAYSTGRGVPENSRNALKWYLKAAEQGLLRHNQRLGKFMLMGARVCLKIISRPIFGITWQVYIRKNLRMIVQRSLPKETDSRERSPQINLARHMPPLISSGEKSTNQRRRKRLPGRSIDKIANKPWRHGVKSACGVRIWGSAD